MQDVARQAVRDYVERTSRADLIEAVMDAELPRCVHRQLSERWTPTPT